MLFSHIMTITQKSTSSQLWLCMNVLQYRTPVSPNYFWGYWSPQRPARTEGIRGMSNKLFCRFVVIAAVVVAVQLKTIKPEPSGTVNIFRRDLLHSHRQDKLQVSNEAIIVLWIFFKVKANTSYWQRITCTSFTKWPLSVKCNVDMSPFTVPHALSFKRRCYMSIEKISAYHNMSYVKVCEIVVLAPHTQLTFTQMRELTWQYRMPIAPSTPHVQRSNTNVFAM